MKTDWEEYGAQCGPGWKPLYEPLVEETLRLGGKVLQVKEKFGGLRFYCKLPKDADTAAVEQLYMRVVEAEAKSYVTCEECGQPGTRKYMATLCVEHMKEHEERFRE